VPSPADDLLEAYWESIVQDPRGQIRTGVQFISAASLRSSGTSCACAVAVTASLKSRLWTLCVSTEPMRSVKTSA
jgi:hypothetical protein